MSCIKCYITPLVTPHLPPAAASSAICFPRPPPDSRNRHSTKINTTPSLCLLSTVSEQMASFYNAILRLRASTSFSVSLAGACSSPSIHFAALRCFSNVPENSVYGGPQPQSPNQHVTLTHLRQKHRKGEPITVVTAYDYPSAVHLDMAGIDVCLVGDSASMVVHGHDTTLPISLDEMLVHCRAVARGATRPLLVGDLPFGTYESSANQVLPCSLFPLC